MKQEAGDESESDSDDDNSDSDNDKKISAVKKKRVADDDKKQRPVK